MDDQNEELACSPTNALSALLSTGTFNSNYRVLGSQLGLDTTDLNSCKEAHGAAHDYKQRLFNVLEKCAEKHELSWAKLVEVLRRPALNEHTVAEHVKHYPYMSTRRGSSISSDSAVSLSLSASMSSSGPFSPTSPTPMEYSMPYLTAETTSQAKNAPEPISTYTTHRAKDNYLQQPPQESTTSMLLPTKLDQVLDFDNGDVPLHLGKIADSMHEWEGPVAEQLGLTLVDIAAIRTKHPLDLRQQT